VTGAQMFLAPTRDLRVRCPPSSGIRPGFLHPHEPDSPDFSARIPGTPPGTSYPIIGQTIDGARAVGGEGHVFTDASRLERWLRGLSA